MRRSVIVAALVLFGLPFVPLLVWAVSGQWRYPALTPQHLSDRGLLALTGGDVLRALATSTAVASAVTVVACALGLPAGRALGVHRFRGRRFVRFLLLAPAIVPVLAIALGVQVVLIRYGLAGTLPGVVVVQLTAAVPYVSTVLSGAFATLDLDYERQARALGARPGQVTLFVTLPLIRPALVVAALLAFLISWSEYIVTLLVGAGRVVTLPVLFFALIGSSDTTAAAAVSLAVIVPPLLLVLAGARFLRSESSLVLGLGRL